VERIHASRGVTIDIAGEKTKVFRGEQQDLEEMIGNLVDNAALHGGGRVFITIGGGPDEVEVLVEDDGKGIPEAGRARLFSRGERLDTTKPGTGLGLAIVRDVAEIYGGRVVLEESEDLGGLLVRLTLPAAEG
jgi:signal transduction histidine kinase